MYRGVIDSFVLLTVCLLFRNALYFIVIMNFLRKYKYIFTIWLLSLLLLFVFVVHKNSRNPFDNEWWHFVDPIALYNDRFWYNNDLAQGFSLCSNMWLTNVYSTMFSSLWIAECHDKESSITTVSTIEVSLLAFLRPYHTLVWVLEYNSISWSIRYTWSLVDIKTYRRQNQSNLNQYDYNLPIKNFFHNR